MKIGILTFHRAHNYGAFLQCYALQSFLNSIGNDVLVLDYYPEYFKKNYSPQFIENSLNLSFFKRLKKMLGMLFVYVPRLIRQKSFNQSIINDLPLSKTFSTKNDFSFANDFDVIVFGSDQIWCPKWTEGFDDVFWGNFTFNGKKISYAASAGDKFNDLEKNLDYIKNNLLSFNKISVREHSLQCFIHEKFNMTSSVVMDPVFLLNSDDWKRYCEKEKSETARYLLLYIVKPSEEAIKIANFIANQKKLKVITLYAGITKKIKSWKGASYSPRKFVSLLENASFVVTTSFHGTSFSILFEKDFYFVKSSSDNFRVENLLKSLNLEGRIISHCNEVELSKESKYEFEKFNFLQKQSKKILLEIK